MNENEFPIQILTPLLSSENFPIQMFQYTEAFPTGKSPHRHQGFELRIILNAQNRIRRFDLIHPGICHCNLSTEEHRRALILELLAEEFSISWEKGSFPRLFSPELAGVLAMLEKFRTPCSEADLLELRLTLALLLLHSRASDNLTAPRIAGMVRYLETHYYEHDLSIAQCARAAGYSERYVQRLFRQETGMTPMDYLLKIRMTAAAGFLRERKYLVKEVALLSGYEDAHFFATVFRKYYRCTPSQYAEQSRNAL